MCHPDCIISTRGRPRPLSLYQVVTQLTKFRQTFEGKYLVFPMGRPTSSLEAFFTRGIKIFKQRFPDYANKRWTFHLLRISGICERFAAGCQIDALVIIARHSDWRTTLAVYVAKLFHQRAPGSLLSSENCTGVRTSLF